MVPFSAAVEDASRGNPKLPQSSFMKTGSFPVIDQGQRPIAGYTDDEALLCRVPGPVIVFGDHTRAFKYVDHPFVIGADGVKVLRVRSGWDPKYVFHYFASRYIPSAGYSRHFKFLKELEVPQPPLDEQRRVAAILDKADALRARRRQSLVDLEDLTQSLFHGMFSGPGADWKCPIPLAQAVRKGTIVTYGIVQAGPEFPGGVPYIRSGDLVDGGIAEMQLRRTDPAIATRFERSRVRTNDIVMSIRATVGTTALVPESLDGANLTQGTARISPGRDVLPEFLLEYLRSPEVQGWIRRQAKGATFREITLSRLRELEVSRPPLVLQREFVQNARDIGRQRIRLSASSDELVNLSEALQQRAFSGRL